MPPQMNAGFEPYAIWHFQRLLSASDSISPGNRLVLSPRDYISPVEESGYYLYTHFFKIGKLDQEIFLPERLDWPHSFLWVG